MKLDEFVQTTIDQVMTGIANADKSLRDKKIGRVWDENIRTFGQDLVNVKILKGGDAQPGPSVPVLVMEFEVKVVARDEKGGSAGAGVQLHALSIGAKGTKKSALDQTHTVGFSVPVGLDLKAGLASEAGDSIGPPSHTGGHHG